MATATRAWIPFFCSKTKTHMLALFEEFEGVWNLTAVDRTDSTAASERSGPLNIVGSFGLSPEYSGCPVCHADSCAQCGECAQLSCWQYGSMRFQCGMCGNVGDVSGAIESLSPLDLA
jgi:hypothetical protein